LGLQLTVVRRAPTSRVGFQDLLFCSSPHRELPVDHGTGDPSDGTVASPRHGWDVYRTVPYRTVVVLYVVGTVRLW
jgi:hypothetical protein